MMLSKENGFYPFLDVSKKAVMEMKIAGELDARIIEVAKNRVMSAIKHKRLPLPTYFSEQDILDDIRSYAAARLIISLMNRKIDAFVEAESSRALELCRRNRQEGYLMKELGVELTADMYLPLRDYLILGLQFSGMVLSNRHVRDGYVKVQEHEITVMLKEAIRNRVGRDLPIRESLINDDIRKMLKPIVSEILSEISLSSPALGRQSADLAPCIERIIEELRSGAKVSHIKRWALAVFLTKRGWDEDKIVSVFSTAPNFDEKLTRYQLQHVRAKGYSMPSCYNLKSQGICIAECGIKNPLQYRKKEMAEKKSDGG